MKWIALRNDDHYINQLIAIQRDYWHMHCDVSASTQHMVYYLKKRFFNPNRQPFTFSFKVKLLSLYSQPVVNEKDIIMLLDTLYTFKGAAAQL